MKLIATLSTVALVPVLLVTGPATAAPAAPAAGGQVTVVQALPGAAVDVSVDGKVVQRRAQVGSLVGVLTLSRGDHEIAFSRVPGEQSVTTRVRVEKGSNQDVVIHRPASVDGAAVVNTYRTPRSPIGPGKARVLIAHTATVAPADVRVDGKVVFTNIANGEYADADVPAGTHRVELLPTGASTNPILGPLSVGLEARTATMVYAVGNPRGGSMDAIRHTLALSSDGSVAPRSVDTGAAGLAHLSSRPFHTALATDPVTTSPTAPGRTPRGWGLDWLVGGVGAVLVTLLVVGAAASTRSRARRRPPPAAVSSA